MGWNLVAGRPGSGRKVARNGTCVVIAGFSVSVGGEETAMGEARLACKLLRQIGKNLFRLAVTGKDRVSLGGMTTRV